MNSTMTWDDLRPLRELLSSPALMARVSQAKGASPVDLGLALRDLAEPLLPSDLSPEQAVKQLLDVGELGAARLLADTTGTTLPPANVTRAAARFAQEVADVSREIHGLLLTLKDSRIERVEQISLWFNEVLHDDLLRDVRPGRLLALLKPLAVELDSLSRGALVRVRADYTKLKEREQSVLDPDFSIALTRLGDAQRSVESLPLAERLVHIAWRLAEAKPLAPEDIRSLHADPPGRLRLTRRRTEYPARVVHAVDVLTFLTEHSRSFSWPSEFDRDRTIELFKALVPQASSYNTETIGRRMVQFLGISGDISKIEKRSLGSTLKITIPRPRIPAFRTGDRMYPGGVLLVLPHRADESTIPALLNTVPAGVLPIVYFPGRVEKVLRQHFALQRDTPHIDNVDLLRLAECPIDQRPHALQQLLLARVSVNPLKPYQQGGPVAPEMFRGRRELVEKLKQPKGGTVLFSGRMMGKSSILHKIQDDIQSETTSTRKQLCVFVSSSADDLLSPLVTRLVELNRGAYSKFETVEKKNAPLATTSPAERKERYRRRLQNLRAVVKAIVSGAHLTILVDEADKFAAADGERPREDSVAWTLRDLEFETPDRLRIVFAGFQTIHQQTLFKNGAFANWFGLEQLGPLDTPDAAALVREPFADFGFVFSSEAGVERILEFTGRHPLLVQEFCLRLMDRVASRRRHTTDDEFVLIEAGDVEAICRDDRIRDRVRQVLSLNLDDYPRLKLMVYLILFAASTAAKGGLTLESFRLDDLREVLIDFYEDRFNEFFDERSIGALVQELMALGLLWRQGDSYAFANPTFANMLREDRQFETHLTTLLTEATAPRRSSARRFVTLSEEDLERLLRVNTTQTPLLVAGLPKSARTFIAERLFSGETTADAVLVNASQCTTLGQLLDLMKDKLGDRQKRATMSDLVVRASIATLAVDDVDALARGKALADLIRELSERDVRLVLFGGPELVRCYVRVLLGLGADLLPLRRLTPIDIRSWGEHAARRNDSFQVTFDEQTSKELHAVTGGHLPLIDRFAQFLRRSGPTRREFIPDMNEVRSFLKDITPEVVRSTLLAALNDGETTVLKDLHRFARLEGIWDIEWEFVRDEVIPASRLDPASWVDSYEVVRALDLVAENSQRGGRRVVIDAGGPLDRLFAVEPE